MVHRPPPSPRPIPPPAARNARSQRTLTTPPRNFATPGMRDGDVETGGDTGGMLPRMLPRESREPRTTTRTATRGAPATPATPARTGRWPRRVPRLRRLVDDRWSMDDGLRHVPRHAWGGGGEARGGGDLVELILLLCAFCFVPPGAARRPCDLRRATCEPGGWPLFFFWGEWGVQQQEPPKWAWQQFVQSPPSLARKTTK